MFPLGLRVPPHLTGSQSPGSNPSGTVYAAKVSPVSPRQLTWFLRLGAAGSFLQCRRTLCASPPMILRFLWVASCVRTSDSGAVYGKVLKHLIKWGGGSLLTPILQGRAVESQRGDCPMRPASPTDFCTWFKMSKRQSPPQKINS